MKGKVYLIGAGPGDPGLFTVKGIEALGKCDVVIYDYLVNPSLLRYVKDDAELICGDKKGTRTKDGFIINQNTINDLIIRFAKQGKNVARLKSGDPFVFGRGGEEAELCVKNKIQFEIVPGITAAMGLAYAGFPLTHRKYASSVSLITGHEDPTKEITSIDWKNLSYMGTLVFYMGVENLSKIIAKLVENGIDKNTKVALVEWVTFGKQRTIVGDIRDIVNKAKKAKVEAPALIVVGNVINLRKELNWFEKKPLFGKTVLVTRTSAQAGSLSSKLLNLGAYVVEFPTIDIKPIKDLSKLDQAISDLKSYDWLIFTSTNGVDHFFKRIIEKKLDAKVLAHIKIGAIGPATSKQLSRYNIKADYVPKVFVGEGVVAGFPGSLKNKNVLIPRAQVARDVIEVSMEKKGAKVDIVPVYRTVSAKPKAWTPFMVEQMLKDEKIDIITFTSSSTVDNFFKIIDKRKVKKVKLASIGPITSKTIRSKGLKVGVQAKVFTIDGLIRSIS